MAWDYLILLIFVLITILSTEAFFPLHNKGNGAPPLVMYVLINTAFYTVDITKSGRMEALVCFEGFLIFFSNSLVFYRWLHVSFYPDYEGEMGGKTCRMDGWMYDKLLFFWFVVYLLSSLSSCENMSDTIWLRWFTFHISIFIRT
jgi:hypothetical protein